MPSTQFFVCALLSSLLALAGCGTESPSSLAAKTAAARYPIVLHHGLLGFNRVLFLDYFYQVKATLEGDGHVVYATQVSTVGSMEDRAEQLAGQVDRVLAETGAAKVNIIAHSMGGLDARHLISVLGYGDRVGILVTLGTPHRGTPIADLASSVVDLDSSRVAAALERLFLGDEEDRAARRGLGKIDLSGALWSLSEARLRSDAFRETHRDDPRVVYESFAGQSTLTGLGTPDMVHPLLSLTYAYLRVAAGANDGLVPVESARHGLDRGIIPADHINMIGQLFGETSSSFRHRDFYRSLASNLAARGF